MATSSNQSAMTADAFLGTLGVNVQMSQGVAEYDSASTVISDLQYLGIWNLRDGYNSYWQDNYVTVGAAGAKFDFVSAVGDSHSPSDIQQFLSGVASVEQAAPGSVAAVEGPNEINNWPVTWTGGVTGLQAAVDFQQSLYSQAKADTALPGVSVYYFTGYGAGSNAEGPNPATTSGLADYDNQHPYPNNGNPPEMWVNRTQALDNETPPTGPAVYTETGYSTYDVSQSVQAKYTLDLLMDDAKNGISKTYLFQLMDDGDGYGLYTSTNQPLPVATAIHNLTSILADPGGSAAAATMSVSLNYSLSGLPSDGNSLLLAKSNGASDLVLWAEPQISGTGSGPTENVTVSLGAAYQTVKVFDPRTGTSPVETLNNVSSLSVGLTDHPLIVEVEPNEVAPMPWTVSQPR